MYLSLGARSTLPETCLLVLVSYRPLGGDARSSWPCGRDADSIICGIFYTRGMGRGEGSGRDLASVRGLRRRRLRRRRRRLPRRKVHTGIRARRQARQPRAFARGALARLLVRVRVRAPIAVRGVTHRAVFARLAHVVAATARATIFDHACWLIFVLEDAPDLSGVCA